MHTMDNHTRNVTLRQLLFVAVNMAFLSRALRTAKAAQRVGLKTTAFPTLVHRLASLPARQSNWVSRSNMAPCRSMSDTKQWVKKEYIGVTHVPPPVDDTVPEEEKVQLTFIDDKGHRSHGWGRVGESILDAIRRNGVYIRAECGGAGNRPTNNPIVADYDYDVGPQCNTCHVRIPKEYLDGLPPMQEAEAEIFDFYEFRTLSKNSRLACQVELEPACDGMVISIADCDTDHAIN